VQQGKLQNKCKVSQEHRCQRKKGECPINQPSRQWDSGPQTIRQTTKRQLINNLTQGTLGYKINKQNNHKGTTMCQSPAIRDRSHTQYTTQNINHTISKQFSGLICRYMTNSNRKTHHKKHTALQSDTTTRRTGHCSGLLPWTGRRIRERRVRRCRPAGDATRRRPTSRLADPRSSERPLRCRS